MALLSVYHLKEAPTFLCYNIEILRTKLQSKSNFNDPVVKIESMRSKFKSSIKRKYEFTIETLSTKLNLGQA